MCLAAVEGWIKVGKGQGCRQRKGVFMLVLVGGRVVNKNNSWARRKQKEEEEEAGFVACYSTASRESEIKWLLAVGEKCETMIHVNEKPWT